jgi:cold shock CspA family protein
MRGTMLWFDDEFKHHGFIETEDGERLRVDRDAFLEGEVPEGRCKGVAVAFQVEGEGENRRAIAVSFSTEAAPRRARNRARSIR